MMFSIPQVAQRNVLEVSCVATINRELRGSIALLSAMYWTFHVLQLSNLGLGIALVGRPAHIR